MLQPVNGFPLYGTTFATRDFQLFPAREFPKGKWRQLLSKASPPSVWGEKATRALSCGLFNTFEFTVRNEEASRWGRCQRNKCRAAQNGCIRAKKHSNYWWDMLKALMMRLRSIERCDSIYLHLLSPFRCLAQDKIYFLRMPSNIHINWTIFVPIAHAILDAVKSVSGHLKKYLSLCFAQLQVLENEAKQSSDTLLCFVGGAGFIASHVVRRLIHNYPHYKVTVCCQSAF